jgi:hypothetical protein
LAVLEKVDWSMRRRLRKFLPIVLLALAVQILAPIAACWAAGIAASDPLHTAVICHDAAAATQGPANNQDDQTGQPRAHGDCCSICSVAHAGAPLDPPQTAVATPYRQPARVVWLDRTADPAGSRTGSHAQARAPPSLT